jgi:hypothetical protein
MGLSLGLWVNRLAFLALLSVGPMAIAVGQTGNTSSSRAGSPIGFDISAQPLASALDAYVKVTGLEVLYDSELAIGRRSTAVSGTLMPDVALRILLEGTELNVEYSANAFAIVPAPMPHHGKEQAIGSVRPSQLPYLAIVQGTIERAFCERADTAPGSYRVVLQFRIGTSGEILYPRLLGSTGEAERDRAIEDLLRRLHIPQPPPPGMPQPLTMVVSPRPPAQSGDCAGQTSSAQRAAR